jgi:hypothetical protein
MSKRVYARRSYKLSRFEWEVVFEHFPMPVPQSTPPHRDDLLRYMRSCDGISADDYSEKLMRAYIASKKLRVIVVRHDDGFWVMKFSEDALRMAMSDHMEDFMYENEHFNLSDAYELVEPNAIVVFERTL